MLKVSGEPPTKCLGTSRRFVSFSRKSAFQEAIKAHTLSGRKRVEEEARAKRILPLIRHRGRVRDQLHGRNLPVRRRFASVARDAEGEGAVHDTQHHRRSVERAGDVRWGEWQAAEEAVVRHRDEAVGRVQRVHGALQRCTGWLAKRDCRILVE